MSKQYGATLALVTLCQNLRAAGHEDHVQKIFAAEKALDRALRPSVTYDYMPALTRLRNLEAEAEQMLKGERA